MKTKELCKDYIPGAVMGKERRVCFFFISTGPGAGACQRPDHFMCEYWVEAQKVRTVRQKSTEAAMKSAEEITKTADENLKSAGR